MNWLLERLFPRLTEKQRYRIETAFYITVIVVGEVGWIIFLIFFKDDWL